MSLARLVYYSAIIGGWAAFFGWLLTALLFPRMGIKEGLLFTALVGGSVGAAIGAGVSSAAGLGNPQLKLLLARIVPGLIGGAVGGFVGALLGDALFALPPDDTPAWILSVLRAFGWILLGVGVGVIEGVYERAPNKIVNGVIGGALGGLLGGLLFDPLHHLLGPQSGMTSLATGFVVLGVCIGALIGLAQVVLKHAWVTVLDGYRTGRQLILSQPIIVLGRAEHLPLPFIGASNQGLEFEHARISRQPNGGFMIEDLKTQLGTRLNSQPLKAPTPLKDGDVIKIGANSIRFNIRQRRADEESTSPTVGSTPAPRSAPPPPKPPGANRASVPPPPKPPGKPADLAPQKPATKPANALLKPPSPPPKPVAPAAKTVHPVNPPAATPATVRRAPPPPPPPPPRRPNA